MREGRAVTPLMMQKNCLRRCSLRHCNISLEGTQFLVKGKIPSTVRYLLQNEFLYFMEYSRIFETPSTPPPAILHCWESPLLSPVSSGIAWTALEICASPIPTGSPWRGRSLTWIATTPWRLEAIAIAWHFYLGNGFPVLYINTRIVIYSFPNTLFGIFWWFELCCLCILNP